LRDMLAHIMDSELRGLRRRVEEVLARYRRVRLSVRPQWYSLERVRRSSAIASDSSFLGVLTRYAFIYAIRAFSAPFTGSAEDVVKRGRYLARFDALELISGYGGGQEPQRDRKGVVHHMAKDLEVASARMVFESMESPPDLVLFDGSLRSFLYNKFRGGDELSEALKRSWAERVESIKRLSTGNDPLDLESLSKWLEIVQRIQEIKRGLHGAPPQQGQPQQRKQGGEKEGR